MRSMLLLVFFSMAASWANGQSAERMVSACRKVPEAKLSDDGKIALGSDYDTGMCWGAFAAIQGLMGFTFEGESQPVLLICPPQRATRTQHIAVFVKYAQRNPQQLSDDFVLVAWRALKEAFPCPEAK